jgi:hypothetical protein
MTKTISSVASSLAALILKRSYEAGKTIGIPSLGIIIKRPEPGYENVIPAGEGWYSFTNGKWRFTGVNNGRSRYLTKADLFQFAIDAARALKEK